MNLGPAGGEADVMVEMNTTPLIDVMLVLLVMLIITLPIQTHAVKLDMPRPDQTPPTAQPEVVDLEIDFDGTPIWNGQPVTSRLQLDGYFLSVAEQADQPEIHLKPNRLAKYGAVAVALADAQRLGVKKIGFVGNEQYLE
jgi:biopolymer transport protein ExbD